MRKRYEKYKDSGIEWIGEVPNEWKLKKLKNLGHIKSSNIDKKDEYDVKAFVVHYNDVIKNSIVDENTSLKITSCTKNQYVSYKLKYGDLVITKDSMDARNIADITLIVDKKRDIICGYHLYLFSIKDNNVLPKYYYYCLKNDNMKKIFLMLSFGTTIIGLSRTSLSNTSFPYPPLAEQETIAHYLNQKTSEIDSLKTDKEKLIQRLQEYKQSVITEAVTKGLDPDVKMKDSGVEWIGEVPEHWGAIKLKYLSSVLSSNVDKKVNEGETKVKLCNYIDVYYNEKICSNIKFMEASATKNEINKFKLNKDDVIITKDSETWDDIAVPAYVTQNFQDVLCGYHLALIRSNQNLMLGTYMFRALISNGVREQFMVSANGVTRYGLSIRSIDSIVVPVPPLNEQKAISDYLEMLSSQIEKAISNINIQIQKLKEYRQSLIYEAVTGKIDVRDYKLENYGLERSESLA